MTFTVFYITKTVSRDFRPLVFSSNNTFGSIDSWVKAVSNLVSYLRGYSAMKIADFKFYFTAMGLARSPTVPFAFLFL
jgi:hypothetical protein